MVRVALEVLADVSRGRSGGGGDSMPDVIMAEFGSGLVDEYGAAAVLRCEAVRRRVRALVVCAGDLTGAWGAQHVVEGCGLQATVFSGPAFNSESCVRFVEAEWGVSAESNRGAMAKTLQLVTEGSEGL